MSYAGLGKVYNSSTLGTIAAGGTSDIAISFSLEHPVALKSINVTLGVNCTINNILIDGDDIGTTALNDLIAIYGMAPYVEKSITINISNADAADQVNTVDIVGLKKS